MSKTTENAPKPRSPRKPPRDYKQRLKEACLESLATQIQQYPPKDSQELELIKQRLSVCAYSRCNETACRYPTHQKCLTPIKQETQVTKYQSNRAYMCANYKYCDTPGNCKPTFLQSLDDTKLKEYDIIYTPERTIKIAELFNLEEQVYICPARLKACRVASGLTFSQIESLSWVTRSWLNRCEKFPSKNLRQKVKMEKSLCYFLAALYGTTPGYLMGHTNSVNSDLFTTQYKYRKKGKKSYVHEPPIIRELSLTLYCLSKDRINGLKAIKSLEKIIDKHPNSSEMRALCDFISKGKNIYFTDFPREIRSELNKFLAGLLHTTPNESAK